VALCLLNLNVLSLIASQRYTVLASWHVQKWIFFFKKSLKEALVWNKTNHICPEKAPFREFGDRESCINKKRGRDSCINKKRCWRLSPDDSGGGGIGDAATVFIVLPCCS
jgi:hypothetical protein